MKTPWEIELIKPEQKWEITLNDKVAYTLPIASPEQLGGVKPDGKTEEMTLPVGVDEQGKLWTSGSDEAVLFTEQILTDEQKAQARENIGAIDTSAIPIKPFPKNAVGPFNLPGTDVFQLEEGPYIWDSSDGSGGGLYAVADDGTTKVITAISLNEIYDVMLSASAIQITGNNTTYRINTTDKSTSNNILVQYTYNQKYLGLTNNEYVPTKDYHPATKKYVNDSVAGIPQADWSQTDEAAADFIKNKPEIATDDEIIEMLTQEDMLPVVTDSDGSILADENDNILLW